MPDTAGGSVLSWRDAWEKLKHPAFDAVRSSLETLPGTEWPGIAALNQRLHGIRNYRQVELKFVDPVAGAALGQHYELRIAEAGEIATRANWHDLFNALAWTAFPRAKSAISEMHARIIASRGEAELKRRSVARDVLTLFDESGAIGGIQQSVLVRPRPKR